MGSGAKERNPRHASRFLRCEVFLHPSGRMGRSRRDQLREKLEQAAVQATISETLRTLREAQSSINTALANTSAATKTVSRAEVNLDRDREYASRSIDMAIMSLAAPMPAGAADGGCKLAIAMLLKAPNLAALGTFVR